jgi:hypothetical protein
VGPPFGAAWKAGRPRVQIGVEFANQGLFHRYPAVLVALAMHVNDTAVVCRPDVANVGAHQLVRA